MGKILSFKNILNTEQASLHVYVYLPASEASREVANLVEGKNPHTPVYGLKEFVCLSVTNFDSNYLGTGQTEWVKKSFFFF